jgi:hypothetical protein
MVEINSHLLLASASRLLGGKFPCLPIRISSPYLVGQLSKLRPRLKGSKKVAVKPGKVRYGAFILPIERERCF